MRNHELFATHYSAIDKICRQQAYRIVHKNPGADFDDLHNIGLTRAFKEIGRYDGSLGHSVGQFLALHVRGEMIDSLREAEWRSRQNLRVCKRHDAAVNRFVAAHGRAPDDDELAAELGVDLKEVRRIVAEVLMPGVFNNTLDAPPPGADGREEPLSASIADASGEDPRLTTRRTELLRRVLKGLDRRTRLVLIMYFFEGYTMWEISRDLDVSESRISQIVTKTLAFLKTRLTPEDLVL